MKNEQKLNQILEEGFNFKPVAQSQAMKKYWRNTINFIVNDSEGLEHLFLNYLCDGRAIGSSVSQLREFVRYQGRGKDITAATLNSKIGTNDLEGLIDDLEELFLEPFCKSNKKLYIERLDKAIKMGVDGQAIIKWHKSGQRHIALIINPQRVLCN